jgi:hypothetical protein
MRQGQLDLDQLHVEAPNVDEDAPEPGVL